MLELTAVIADTFISLLDRFFVLSVFFVMPHFACFHSHCSNVMMFQYSICICIKVISDTAFLINENTACNRYEFTVSAHYLLCIVKCCCFIPFHFEVYKYVAGGIVLVQLQLILYAIVRNIMVEL